MKKWFVAGCILLTGCTGQKFVDTGEVHTFPLNMKPLSQILDETDVQCQSQDACPEQVGEIIGIIKSDGVTTSGEVCTGWLVAPDIIATNSHCIPEQFKKGETNCTDSLGIKFPAGNGRGPEIHMCKEVIGFSQIDHKHQAAHPDWAFFRLDHATSRKPFKISRVGLSNDALVKAYTVNPIAKDAATGRLVLKHCQATQGSLLEPDYDYDFANVALITGDDCKMIPGNSGSPVLNENGEVPVILFATNLDPKKSLQVLEKQLGIGFPSKATYAAYVTNYACLDLPASIPVPQSPPECSPDSKEALAKASKERLDKNISAPADQEMKQVEQEFAQNTSSPARFNIAGQYVTDSSFQHDGTLDVNIKCLLPKSQWPAGSYSLDGSILKMSYNVPVLKYRLVLDEKMRAGAQRLGEDYNKIDFSIDISRVEDQNMIVGEKTETGVVNQQWPVITHWCGPADLQNTLKVSDK